MCVAFFAFDAHPLLLFVLAFNRDEALARPTLPLHFWNDHPSILGGRDAKENGTWLAISREGRISFVTNFREGINPPRGPKSRGAIPVDFILGHQPPSDFLKGIATADYTWFNSFAAEFLNLHNPKAAYMCSRKESKPIDIEAGFHSFSNGHINDKWPKCMTGRDALKGVLESASLEGRAFPWTEIFENVLDREETVQNESKLPKTGIDMELEKRLSAIRIPPFQAPMGLYATRCQTVVAVWRDGFVEAKERTRTAENYHSFEESYHSFTIERTRQPIDHSEL